MSILTPSEESTSAAPERDESARLPCLATGTPAPATMKEAQVETLTEPEPSPPVPGTTSTAPAGASTRSILARHRRYRAGDPHRTVSPRNAQRHQQSAHLRGRRLRPTFMLSQKRMRPDLARATASRPVATFPMIDLRSRDRLPFGMLSSILQHDPLRRTGLRVYRIMLKLFARSPVHCLGRHGPIDRTCQCRIQAW